MSDDLNDDNRLPQWLRDSSDRIINHMNSDHANSIISSLNVIYEIKDTSAKMVNLEVDGYHILSNGELYFIPFSRNCKSVEEYKTELIKQAQLYRSF